jgi:hypothetical protein
MLWSQYDSMNLKTNINSIQNRIQLLRRKEEAQRKKIDEKRNVINHVNQVRVMAIRQREDTVESV